MYVFAPSTTASPLLGSVDVQCIKISSLPSLHTCASLALPDGVVSQVQRRKQILEQGNIQYTLCLNTIRKKQGSQATATILFSYQLHFEIKPVCQYPLQLIYIKGSGHHPSQSEARFLWHFFAIFGEYLYINFKYLTKLGIYV